MAVNANWKTVELQIEAFIPGIIIAVEVNALARIWLDVCLQQKIGFPPTSVIFGSAFVAVAYAMGLASSVLSRAVIDWLSERGPRAWTFRFFSHARLRTLARRFWRLDRARFKADLSEEKIRRRCRYVAFWNAVYRSALRKAKQVSEVDRRRSQGRLFRNLLFPGVFGSFLITGHFWSGLICAAIWFPACLFGYAYSEYINFAEASDVL